MKYLLFIGCNIPARVKQYEISARAVLTRLGIETADDPAFKCCGNPIRNTDLESFLVMAAYNLALAENRGVDMMVLCKCCFGSLKKAAHLLDRDSELRDRVNDSLSGEGVEYTRSPKIKHFLSVLYHDIGILALKEKISRPYIDLNIATHYGCHALRPGKVTRFDNPVAPVLFDELVKLTGAESVDWTLKLECCGAPVLGIQDDLSMNLTRRKIKNGLGAGADFLCVACPFCQMQFDRVQQMMSRDPERDHGLAALVYPQLLGLAMGMGPDTLALDMNEMNIGHIESYRG